VQKKNYFNNSKHQTVNKKKMNQNKNKTKKDHFAKTYPPRSMNPTNIIIVFLCGHMKREKCPKMGR